MEISYAIEVENFKKKYKGFTLDVEKCGIPKGFATAVIGENGAGKTTLISALAGIRLDYKGKVRYFDERIDDVDKVKNFLGYTGPGSFFLPHWTVKQIEEVGKLIFDDFDKEKFKKLCRELGIVGENTSKKISSLSDGNRMKLTIATALARNTKCLIMDEPASPLDPLMRDKLCSIIREYIEEGLGERSVLFSTHNISDMENVTDYCIIMEQGKIVEEGFVEELKEKYVLVKGESKDIEVGKNACYSINVSPYGFEGMCLSENLEKLTGCKISTEIPSLFQISVAVMKENSLLKFN